MTLSSELQSLIDEALALVAESVAEGRRPAPFVLVRTGDEQSQMRLPREAEARATELDEALADLGQSVDAYALVVPGDDGDALVEAEERDAGYAVQLRADASGPGRPQRVANRLVAARGDFSSEEPVVLFEALLCVVRADGRVDDDEMAMLRGFAATVPTLARYEVDALYEAARQQLALAGGDVDAALRHLDLLQGDGARRRCYVLASEVAHVAGVDRAERAVLERIGDALGLDGDFVSAVERTLSLKYEPPTPHEIGPLALTAIAVITADGTFDRAEMTVVQELARTLPGVDRDALMLELTAAQRTLQQAGGVDAVVEAIANALSPDAPVAALVTLAIELAMASDGLDPRESRLVSALAQRLEVTRDLDSVIDVFRAKYASV